MQGKHEPIVTPELFYRAQLMRGEMRKSKSSNELFIYTNYIKCTKCGCAMVAESKMGAHKSGPYIYYHCTNYKGEHKRQKNISQKLIDEAMQEILESFDISDKELALVKKDVYKGLQELQKYEKNTDGILYSKTIKDKATVREKPSAGGKRVVDLPVNTVLYLEGRLGNYYKIAETDKIRWTTILDAYADSLYYPTERKNNKRRNNTSRRFNRRKLSVFFNIK